MTFSILQLRFSISMAGIILGIVERHGLSKYYNLSQFSFYFSEYFSDCFFFFDFKKATLSTPAIRLLSHTGCLNTPLLFINLFLLCKEY